MRSEKINRRFVAILYLAFFVSFSWGEDADIVIRNAKVISPPSTILDNATVIIKDGRITYVGTKEQKISAKTIIDARGKSVIPGMIDTHVHVSGYAVFQNDDAYNRWVATDAPIRLADFLTHGFTTVLSVGDYWPQILRVREKLVSGEIQGPRLLLSGPLITSAHGHGASEHGKTASGEPACGDTPFCLEHMLKVVSNEAQARAFIDELAAKGADGVKVVYDGPPNVVAKDDAKYDHISSNILKAIVDEAHQHNLPVRAHTSPFDYAVDAMNLGVDGLAHSAFIFHSSPSDSTMADVIAAATAHHVPMSTTLGAMTYETDLFGVDRAVASGTAELATVLKQINAAEIGRQDIRDLHKAGITLAFGTDILAIARPGDALKLEMQRLSETGLPAMDILAMATIDAAKYLKLDNQIGSIQVGRIADVVVVAADPLENLNFLDRIDLVIQGGKVVYDYRSGFMVTPQKTSSSLP